jgi:hypothetical protein
LNSGMGQVGLAGLIAPAWQAAIGVIALTVTIVAGRSLARRGRSRMNRAVVVSGVAIVGLVALGFFFATH